MSTVLRKAFRAEGTAYTDTHNPQWSFHWSKFFSSFKDQGPPLYEALSAFQLTGDPDPPLNPVNLRFMPITSQWVPDYLGHIPHNYFVLLSNSDYTDALPLQLDYDLLRPHMSFYSTWVSRSNKRKVWPFIEDLICAKHIAGHAIIFINKPTRWIFLFPLLKLTLRKIKLLGQGLTANKPKARIQNQIWPKRPRFCYIKIICI